MTKADTAALREPSARPVVARLRDSHHIIARLLVSGLSLAEVAAETGYSIARISTLRSSPAMVELMEQYREADHFEWRKSRDQYYEYTREIGLKAVRKIAEKLDADDDNFVSEIPLRDLLKIYDSSADRVGYHRKSTKENVNINFAARLEAAIDRSRRVTVIDMEPEQ
jgi:hypothetical protein